MALGHPQRAVGWDSCPGKCSQRVWVATPRPGVRLEVSEGRAHCASGVRRQQPALVFPQLKPQLRFPGSTTFVFRRKTPASAEVTRVTGLQLSPASQHLVYCGEAADSSELALCGELKPPISAQNKPSDTDGQQWDWHGLGVGWLVLSPPPFPFMLGE